MHDEKKMKNGGKVCVMVHKNGHMKKVCKLVGREEAQRLMEELFGGGKKGKKGK